jgi:hypothetical protein
MFAVSFLFSCGMVGGMIGPDNTHQVSISAGFTIVGEVGQKCVIQMEMSDSRISCTCNGARRSS